MARRVLRAAHGSSSTIVRIDVARDCLGDAFAAAVEFCDWVSWHSGVPGVHAAVAQRLADYVGIFIDDPDESEDLRGDWPDRLIACLERHGVVAGRVRAGNEVELPAFARSRGRGRPGIGLASVIAGKPRFERISTTPLLAEFVRVVCDVPDVVEYRWGCLGFEEAFDDADELERFFVAVDHIVLFDVAVLTAAGAVWRFQSAWRSVAIYTDGRDDSVPQLAREATDRLRPWGRRLAPYADYSVITAANDPLGGASSKGYFHSPPSWASPDRAMDFDITREVPDAYWWQAVPRGNLACAAAGPAGRAIAANRTEITIGEIVDWFPDNPRYAEQVESARSRLRPALMPRPPTVPPTNFHGKPYAW